MPQRFIDTFLDPQTVEATIEWVKQVRSMKDAYQVTDQKYDRHATSWSVSLMGRLGEVVAQQVLGGTLDDSITPEGDDGSDLLRSGERWQIKTSTRNTLIFNSLNAFNADKAVLVQLCGNRLLPDAPNTRWRIWGTVERQRFTEQHELHNYGYGTRLIMHATRLDRIEL